MIIFSVLSKLRLKCPENLCLSELDLVPEGRRVPLSLQFRAGSDACRREMWHTEGGSIFFSDL